MTRRAGKASDAGFRAVVERHAEALYRIAYHLLGDTHEAEDVVQDAMLSCYRTMDRLAPGSEVGAWLTRIAVNRCRDLLKSHRHNRLALRDPVDMDPVRDLAPNPEEGRALSERERMVREAVNRLPPLYKAILVMRDMEELPYEQIARITRLPITTLKMRVVRARRMIRVWLEGKI